MGIAAFGLVLLLVLDMCGYYISLYMVVSGT